jgi:hypothetical protein
MSQTESASDLGDTEVRVPVDQEEHGVPVRLDLESEVSIQAPGIVGHAIGDALEADGESKGAELAGKVLVRCHLRSRLHICSARKLLDEQLGWEARGDAQ